MFRGKTDMSKMLRRHREIERAGPEMRRDALRQVVGTLLREVSAKAPRDTQRYVRAYEQAAHGISVPIPVSPVRDGKFAEAVLFKVERQFQYWNTRRNQYIAAGRTSEPYYRKVVEKRYRRSKDFLERFSPQSIVIIGRGSVGAKGSKETRVLDKVYGGNAEFVEHSNATYVRLSNREPHAKIVESRHFAMKQLIRRFGGRGGVTRIHGAMAKAIKQAAQSAT